MRYVIAALVALTLFKVPRLQPQAPTDPPIAEIERDTAFSALQRLAIKAAAHHRFPRGEARLSRARCPRHFHYWALWAPSRTGSRQLQSPSFSDAITCDDV